MRVRLSSGKDLVVTGAPPLQRAAVLAALPIPDPPLVEYRRADGGVDLWPNKEDPAWLAERERVLVRRDRALWRFYVLACLPEAEPPADGAWIDALRDVGITPREGAAGRKLDWVELCLLETEADVAALRAAFRDANDTPPEAREAAIAFFSLEWAGQPVHEAAEGLKRGKLAYAAGWLQFRAAERWGLLPLAREEAPDRLHGRLAVGYYDLPPDLRARMEVYCELDYLVQALQADEAYRRATT